MKTEDGATKPIAIRRLIETDLTHPGGAVSIPAMRLFQRKNCHLANDPIHI
jgi:hypothetical protein